MRTVAAVCRELTADRRPDGELLAAFLADRSEAAFLELVRRHGPLVWGACRRLLPDPADAEDAFQAAFLVLVRRAHRLKHNNAVGPWLHRVAVWTARNVRRKNARRLARQHPLTDHVSGSAPDPDLKADIDQALLALPARYRDSIVLCHLQGFTRREAAERLGCAEGTLSAWLNRGLAKLRARLGDLDPAKALVAVPAALATTTARAAVAASHAALVTPAVSSLVEGVLHMLWMKKATAAALAVCAVFALGVGVGLGTRAEHSGATAQEKGATDPKAKPPGVPDRAKQIEEAEIEVMKLKMQQLFHAVRLQDAKDKLAKLKKEVAVEDDGYLELTIGGKAGEPEFTIREWPDGDVTIEGIQRIYGPLVTRDTKMLAKLIARAKADPTGPQQIRVTAQPQTALGTGPVAALRACDATGYKTVTFTGYVVAGGFTAELKPDQTGEAPGYVWYDKKEKKAAELLKEIEEGMKRL